MITAKEFYDREHKGTKYSTRTETKKHPLFKFLSNVIIDYNLSNKKCLEIGCGKGLLQNMVEDYTGIDITDSTKHLFSKPFVSCSATELPFEDNSFDAIWTYAVLEHVPNPEKAFQEMRRVLKPNGILLLHAAWHCHAYAANGYAVRPYSDFDIRGKLIKFISLIHGLTISKTMRLLALRVLVVLRHIFGQKEFHYKKLKPNYTEFWMSDSDAVNSMDQLEAIFWFENKNDNCIYPKSLIRRFFQKDGEIIIRINK